jgi:hypothetical protein
MKKIIAYLILLSCAVLCLSLIHFIIAMPQWYIQSILYFKCAYVGLLGGCLYSIRAVYLNKCVRKCWDADWQAWYYLRPITSTMSAIVSCVFLKAGLLVLESKSQPDAAPFGFLAIAFIAGYNVDNFMKKVESIAHTVWGIEKTGTAAVVEKPKEKEAA